MRITADLMHLLSMARAASENAYAPYSGYKVGAALRCTDGTIFTGCNVENASYSLTNCAERTAVFKAVSEGKRDFDAIAVWVDSDTLFPPCGACRQVLHEFSPKLKVLYGNRNNQILTSIGSLLPSAFTLGK